MKIKLVTGLFILGVFMTACDKISNPIQNASNSVDTATYVRKVLLEDYTGHFCGNCPPAAEVASQLVESNHGKVIAIAVHAGFYAKLYPPDYVTSFTTAVGNDWDGTQGFNVSGIGNPNGMVNRKSYGGSGVVQKETKWPTSVSLALQDQYVLGLTISKTYNASSRILNSTVKAKFKIAYSNNVKLNLVLVEDSIISEQKDYRKNPDLVTNYLFMHLLRAGINGSWGSTLKDAPIAAKDSVSLDFNNFAVDSKFNDNHLYLVAFAYDASTKEILQAEKLKIR
ncbi:MAG TPA: Omp28-related outer membrane protein [Bacteroidia bacterium]|nr:Omp28-related outer membrane protein [Bacteroidia bacterium]